MERPEPALARRADARSVTRLAPPRAARRLMVVGGALVLALAMWYYVLGLLIPEQVGYAGGHATPRGNLSDLYPRWYGARELLLHGRDPYSPAVTYEIQVGYYGRAVGLAGDPQRNSDPKDAQGFAYPIYVAFLLWPVIGLPFGVVQAGFSWLLLLLTAASVPLWMAVVGWRPGGAATLAAILLTLGSFPTAQGVELEQLSLLVGVLLAGCAAALVGGRPALAGVLLALATIKPQVAAPLVAWLALWTASDWRRRQGLAWGFLGSMAVLVMGAQLVAPGWIGRFRDALAAYQQYTDNRSVLGILLTPTGGLVVSAALLAGLAIVCWRVRGAPAGSPGFALALALVTAVTLAIIPTFAPYNQLLLLPGVLLLFARGDQIRQAGRLTRYSVVLAGSFIAWPWVAALGLSLAALVLPAATVQRGWTLPVLTSLFIPLGMLAALAALAVRVLRPAEGNA